MKCRKRERGEGEEEEEEEVDGNINTKQNGKQRAIIGLKCAWSLHDQQRRSLNGSELGEEVSERWEGFSAGEIVVLFPWPCLWFFWKVVLLAHRRPYGTCEAALWIWGRRLYADPPRGSSEGAMSADWWIPRSREFFLRRLRFRVFCGDVCESRLCGFSLDSDPALRRPGAAGRRGTGLGAAGSRPALWRTGDRRGVGGGQRERRDIAGVQAGGRDAHHFCGGLQTGERWWRWWWSCLPLVGLHSDPLTTRDVEDDVKLYTEPGFVPPFGSMFRY